MLRELRVRQLGLIDDLTLLLEPGMTALTGETGAGKTLVVEGLVLLLGGKSDPMLVRPGALEATVEGRFTTDGIAVAGAGIELDAAGDSDDDVGGDAEVALARVIPAGGRSRAYLNGRMAPVGALVAAGERLVDVHGQHAHQSLLVPVAQRQALDAFGVISLEAVADGQRRLRLVDEALSGLGGDERSRARELDLLRFQVAELDEAAIAGPGEDAELAKEEDWLADAGAHRDAAALAQQLLAGEPEDGPRASSARDLIGRAVAAVGGRGPLEPLARRLQNLDAEVEDLSRELRLAAEGFEDDPGRLGQIRERRRLLRELMRKYGEDLTEVLGFAEEARTRLAELVSYDERAAALEAQRVAVAAELARAKAQVAAARRAAAPGLAAAIEDQLRNLAMPRARFGVQVNDDESGEGVTWLLAANPGEPLLPLAKVASGGELARTMLAVRLVLGGVADQGPDAGDIPTPGGARTLIFDEVDAGIGGEAAVAVGRALAELARSHQVLVVTHLAQVAAFADNQVVVRKAEVDGRTVADVEVLTDRQRAVELSRMLSGQPDSATGRRHARELLASARAERGVAE